MDEISSMQSPEIDYAKTSLPLYNKKKFLSAKIIQATIM